MLTDLYQTITLTLSTISVQFGAIVSVFIIYASGEIAQAYREQIAEEEELINPLIVARFDMLQKSAAISTFILLASPVLAIVGVLLAKQLQSYTFFHSINISYIVMIGEIFLFSFAVWLIIVAVGIYLIREMAIHSLLLGDYRPRSTKQQR